MVYVPFFKGLMTQHAYCSSFLFYKLITYLSTPFLLTTVNTTLSREWFEFEGGFAEICFGQRALTSHIGVEILHWDRLSRHGHQHVPFLTTDRRNANNCTSTNQKEHGINQPSSADVIGMSLILHILWWHAVIHKMTEMMGDANQFRKILSFLSLNPVFTCSKTHQMLKFCSFVGEDSRREEGRFQGHFIYITRGWHLLGKDGRKSMQILHKCRNLSSLFSWNSTFFFW